jgi:hypothetical protein
MVLMKTSSKKVLAILLKVYSLAKMTTLCSQVIEIQYLKGLAKLARVIC